MVFVHLSLSLDSPSSWLTACCRCSVHQVDEKIEEFLTEFRGRLDQCSREEFDGQRKSLIAVKQCDDSHMGEESDRLWAEIRDKTHLFNRLDKEVSQSLRGLVDSTLGLVNSSLSFVDSSLSFVDSSLSFVDSSLSFVDSSLSFVDSRLSLVDSSLSFVDSSLSFVDSRLRFMDSWLR